MITLSGQKFFLLLDCNSFFVSCERIFRPDLRKKPVIVLSSSDGCVVARSTEAKALGIKMGEPYFKIKQMLEKSGVFVFSSNFSLYQNISNRVMNVVIESGLSYEISSIDEAFLICEKMTTEDLLQRANLLHFKVFKEIGVPASIGISHTKTLSKLASEIAKQKREPVFILDLNNEETLNIFSNTKIEEVWGMGRQTVAFLNSNKIKTIKQFIDTPSFWVRKNLGIIGEKMWLELQGRVCYELNEKITQNKSISSTRSFKETTDSLSILESAITSHVLKVTQELRFQKQGAKNFRIFISAGYDEKIFIREAKLCFNETTNDAIVVNKKALIKLKEIFVSKINYKKAGVTAYNLEPENFSSQKNLFGEKNEQDKKLLKIIDRLNYIYGNNTITLATLECLKKDKREAKHEMISQSYTDDWREILEIGV